MPTHVTHGGGQTVSPFPGQGHGHGHGTPPPFAQLPVVGVTADSTVWTADTICVTADGRIVCIPAIIAEAANGLDAFDAIAIAGGAVIDADLAEAAAALDQLDAVAIPAAIYLADVAEAAAASDLADAVRDVAADAIEPASAIEALDAVADVAAAMDEPASALDAADAAVGFVVVLAAVDEPADALDQLDAMVETIEVPIAVGGGAHYPRRRLLPVYGIGYGILPRLWGEAHGVVGAVGKSAGQLLVHATAVGACGQAGTAAVVLKGLTVAAKGAVGARGSGDGMIVKFSGSATGRHDDDEAAVLAFLLAA